MPKPRKSAQHLAPRPGGKVSVSIYLDADTAEKVGQLAAECQPPASRSAFIEWVIKQYIEAHPPRAGSAKPQSSKSGR